MIIMNNFTGNKPSELILSTPRSLKATIKNDSNILRWFLVLVFNKNILEKLKSNKGHKGQHKKLRLLINVLFFISIPAFFTCLHTFLFPRSLNTWTTLVLLLSLYLFFRRQVKLTLLTIVNKFIDNEFKEHSFENLSLYQIGEFYASEYNTTPIVEFINKRLSLQALLLFISFFYATFIHPINFLATVLTMAAVLFTLDIYFTVIHIWMLQFKTISQARSKK